MYLNKLELSGFKSFAKTTVLEFPSRITAIVGPNGSGKSNIKEAIQWVLGEQSIKSLRGKKGEDLIWNGSPELARMGKASVTLVFDNSGHALPIEFDEVSIQRKIFRDGVNEYTINNSSVRLKDVVALTAEMGLGESKHNIIGQGEVDRVLLSAPRERYAMLEEALGLRVYQLKKSDAEGKLAATAQNIGQAEALIRELTPHVKFLRIQAHKRETREKLAEELREREQEYFFKEADEIKDEKREIAERIRPLAKKEEDTQKEIARLTKGFAEAEQALSRGEGSDGIAEELASLEATRRERERELGRLEGKLEAEKEKAVESLVSGRAGGQAQAMQAVDIGFLQDEVKKFLADARMIVEEEDEIEMVRAHLLVLLEDLETLFLHGVSERGFSPQKSVLAPPAAKESVAAIAAIQEELRRLGAAIEGRIRAREDEYRVSRGAQSRIREIDALLHGQQDAARDCALERQRVAFEEERIRAREEAFLRALAAAGMSRSALEAGEHGEITPDLTQQEREKKIERLRIRLEEIGAIDPALIKEYEETEARHAFLAKELDDLRRASLALKDLVKELDRHMKKDFREGFAKIKDAFHEYFRVIFGGGKATLRIMNYELGMRNENETEDIQDEEKEEGVEIMVELPRKRIKGLAMLSGGERALTSLALLFAISAVNPPPFLILDETDAALDEANTGRFGALLKELSKKTQLLLVTHNRETMKCAGILYGVTMGDDGVSRLLSLKLEEAEEYTNQ